MTWGDSTSSGRFSLAIRALCTLAVFAVATLSAMPVFAKEKATVVTSARAVVLASLSLLKVDDLDFGKIAARPTTGTVVANPTTKTCTVTGPIIHAGICQLAKFAGRVGSRTQFKVEVQGNTTLRGPSGQAMLLDSMTLAPGDGLSYAGAANPSLAASGNVPLRVTTPSGMFTFFVGGTLHVNANQQPGVYVGTISIQANYQ